MMLVCFFIITLCIPLWVEILVYKFHTYLYITQKSPQLGNIENIFHLVKLLKFGLKMDIPKYEISFCYIAVTSTIIVLENCHFYHTRKVLSTLDSTYLRKITEHWTYWKSQLKSYVKSNWSKRFCKNFNLQCFKCSTSMWNYC